MTADDIEVIHMTAVEWDQALTSSLNDLGLTWEMLTAQARDGEFESLKARQLWLMAGGQGPNQAELAADPGNLPKQMAEVIASHAWTEFPRSAHSQHNYYAECAVCQRDVPRIAEVALGVRDGLVAHLSARAAVAEAKVAHAEAGAQRSSEQLAKVRLELAEANGMASRSAEDSLAHLQRAEKAEAELASLRERLTVLQDREEELLDPLRCQVAAQQAEVERLKNELGQHRLDEQYEALATAGAFDEEDPF